MGVNLLKTEEIGFAYEIVRSKRRKKTLAIKVENDIAKVVIPYRVTQKEALAFLYEKKSWVEKRIAEQIKVLPKTYQEGEVFLFLGESFTLCMVEESDGVSINGHSLCVGTKGKIKQSIAQWYKQQAAEILRERTRHFAKQYELSPSSVIIKNYKARWGACSTKGEIYFNWKLIMAPLDILDYVVVHELCHMIEHNHSSQFWAQVEKTMPDYKKKRKWLQQHGVTLTLD